MAEKKVTKTNTVKIVGYLKENNLEQIVNSRGDQVIRGSVIIATDALSSHKVQFYVAEKTANGEDSKDYASLLKLLPDNTITVASFLKENPEADFNMAANAASKIWAMARFDEYATRTGERTRSLITLKGFRAGFSKADAPFTPCAEFDVDIFINKMTDEEDENGKKTGRVIIEGLIPKYDGSVDKLDFIAVSENNIANYISKNYNVYDTVNIKGDVVSIQSRKMVAGSDNSEFFGRGASTPQYETTFVRERRIMGGSKTPIHQGEEGSVSLEAVKNGLAAREVKMTANGEKASSAPVSKPTPRVTVTADDLDF